MNQGLQTSVMSFEQRGKWGKSSWRGNCSGFVYKGLFEQLKPKTFVDPMVGSGTSVEVALELGIEAVGLDLHSGFNVLRDSIVGKVGKESDLVLSHPPYGAMIVYSGHVWGAAHPDDLSRCKDDADFHEKMQVALLNQRDATRAGGYYGTIIGDWRRNGVYTSYQAEMIARMPFDELAAVLIKGQHNCVSDGKQYAHMALPRIMHEYILLWKKKERATIVLLGQLAKEQYERVKATWRSIVKLVVMKLGGSADLSSIYQAVANAAPEKVGANQHWREKIRQVLNSNPEFAAVGRGQWALA
jgi:hypothetical protein